MTSSGSRESESKPRRLSVFHPTSGSRQPFLRGIVTHDLVQRGLSFDDAYATARAVRDQLADREEISTPELRDLIEQWLEKNLGRGVLADAVSPVPPPVVRVTYNGEAQPFSRGLLAQSLYAAGLGHDRAYRRVLEIQQELHRDGIGRLESRELSRFVAAFLERSEGPKVAGRYRLLRRIRQLPRPLVFYVAGATGTGKSTLSLDLAPLLRIYRINSTDTIRQVMRMVFAPAMLPSLHRSSFEVGEESRERPESERRRLFEATFEEQAVRVCVGVRAVVERAIAENLSIFVEGVHLLPPLVPFPDLDPVAYQIMVMLATLDDEVHRSHFLARANLNRGRRSERYLENFRAIRWQQELLLQRAEEHEIPLIDTTDREQSIQGAIQLFTGAIERQVPWLAKALDDEPWEQPPLLVLAIDGLGDLPVASLGQRSPLEAAELPTFDRLAREGIVGLTDPVAPGVVPDTAAGTLAIFGQVPQAMKRGPIEAIGVGLELAKNHVALRGNLATLDSRGWIQDRRAGRIRDDASALASALDRLRLPGFDTDEVVVRVRAATEHRLAIGLLGEQLSPAIVGSDPGEAAPPGPPLTPRPEDPANQAASRTARILALFEQEARRVLARHPLNHARAERGRLPANCVLTRGAGRVHSLPALQPLGFPLRMACISGDHTVLGVARAVGARCISKPFMTANLDTDLRGKFNTAKRALRDHDLVVVHVKGADIAAHDRRPDLKVGFLEALDRELGRFLARYKGELRLAVVSDHTTYSETGRHGADPVPVLVWGPGVEPDEVERFDERAAAGGGLQRFPLQLLVDKVFEMRAPVKQDL